jgi:hypothetical protein
MAETAKKPTSNRSAKERRNTVELTEPNHDVIKRCSECYVKLR